MVRTLRTLATNQLGACDGALDSLVMTWIKVLIVELEMEKAGKFWRWEVGKFWRCKWFAYAKDFTLCMGVRSTFTRRVCTRP